MAQVLDPAVLSGNESRREREKAIKILAKSIFRQLKSSGYETREIMSLSTEILSLLTAEFRPEAK